MPHYEVNVPLFMITCYINGKSPAPLGSSQPSGSNMARRRRDTAGSPGHWQGSSRWWPTRSRTARQARHSPWQSVSLAAKLFKKPKI